MKSNWLRIVKVVRKNRPHILSGALRKLMGSYHFWCKKIRRYSNKVFSVNDDKGLTIDCNNGGLSMDLVVIEKGAVL